MPVKKAEEKEEETKEKSPQTSHWLNTLFAHAGNKPFPNYKFFHTTLHETKQILQ